MTYAEKASHRLMTDAEGARAAGRLMTDTEKTATAS